MLPRIILLALQILGGWYGALAIRSALPALRDFDIFVWAVLFAVLVYLIGFVGSLVLKGLKAPSSAAFVTCLVLALVLAAIAKWVPQVTTAVGNFGIRVDDKVYPFVGALVGYFLRR